MGNFDQHDASNRLRGQPREEISVPTFVCKQAYMFLHGQVK